MIFLNKKKTKSFCILSSHNVGHAIKNLEKTSAQICIVTDKQGKFLGTITDGDIRRGLLLGIGLKVSVKKIFNNNSITLDRIQQDRAERLMNLYMVKHIPVVSYNKKILGIFFLQSIQKKIISKDTVVIMAGGEGRRLLPYTKLSPKPMLRVHGKPILEHMIISLEKQGFINIYISVNYLKEKIMNYFKNGSKFGVSIKYIIEPKKLGTIGSLSLLKINSIKSKHLIVINSDILTNLNFNNLVDYHKKNKSSATMLSRIFEMKNPFGVIKIINEKISGFEEKPVQKTYINAGIYVISKDCIKYIPKNKRYDTPDFFRHLIRLKKITTIYPMHESWIEIGEVDVFKKITNKKHL
jgi:dTDP-glucose pyrophosphorylase/CBS domain-containing protein